MQALAHALWHAGWLAQFERNPVEVERLASDLIELSNRQNFAPFLRRAAVLRGWLDMPFLVALKAEALHLADRTSDALEAITEVEALIESFENRYWCAELHRLRGVFLTALGADQSQIEAALCEAI